VHRPRPLHLLCPSFLFHRTGEITLLNFARSDRSRNNSCAMRIQPGCGTSRYRRSDLSRRIRMRTCMRALVFTGAYTTRKMEINCMLSRRILIGVISVRPVMYRMIRKIPCLERYRGMNWFWYFRMTNVLLQMGHHCVIFWRKSVERTV